MASIGLVTGTPPSREVPRHARKPPGPPQTPPPGYSPLQERTPPGHRRSRSDSGHRRSGSHSDCDLKELADDLVNHAPAALMFNLNCESYGNDPFAPPTTPPARRKSPSQPRGTYSPGRSTKSPSRTRSDSSMTPTALAADFVRSALASHNSDSDGDTPPHIASAPRPLHRSQLGGPTTNGTSRGAATSAAWSAPAPARRAQSALSPLETTEGTRAGLDGGIAAEGPRSPDARMATASQIDLAISTVRAEESLSSPRGDGYRSTWHPEEEQDAKARQEAREARARAEAARAARRAPRRRAHSFTSRGARRHANLGDSFGTETASSTDAVPLMPPVLPDGSGNVQIEGWLWRRSKARAQ